MPLAGNCSVGVKDENRNGQVDKRLMAETGRVRDKSARCVDADPMRAEQRSSRITTPPPLRDGFADISYVIFEAKPLSNRGTLVNETDRFFSSAQHNFSIESFGVAW